MSEIVKIVEIKDRRGLTQNEVGQRCHQCQCVASFVNICVAKLQQFDPFSRTWQDSADGYTAMFACNEHVHVNQNVGRIFHAVFSRYLPPTDEEPQCQT